MRKVMSMFTIRQKLLLCGSVLFSILLVAGSYFGSRWLHGPDVEPLPEHLLSDRSHGVSMNRPVRASVAQYTPSVIESESVSDIDSTLETEQNFSDEEEELEALLNSLSDEELSALAESLEQDEGESSKYPAVPEGYPNNLKPVWLKHFFDENLHANHVIMGCVGIELWNQGERGFVNITMDCHTGKVYLLYPGVVYVTWKHYSRKAPDGEPIKVPYISYWLGIPSTVDSLLNTDGKIFSEQEIMSGAYTTMYPDVEFVNYNNAGYAPATILRQLLTKEKYHEV